MNRCSPDREMLIDRLRQSLPLAARARQQLVERLSAILSPDAARSNLLVTDLYDAGEEHGVLCQLDLSRHGAKISYLVVPFDQVAFDRRYRLDRKARQRHQRLGALWASKTCGL